MSVLHSDEFDDTGTRPITFHLPSDVDARTVALVGDFNDWSTEEHLLHRQDDGSWHLVLRLAPGRYRFRYLIDGTRWENDWYADEYAANEFGGDDSVVVVPPVGDAGLAPPPNA
jgi:1,4-alpha-glucan branching enzyme